MITYLLGDSLIRIKNGVLARHKSVSVPNSKLVVGVIDALKREGVVREYEVKGEERVVLVYLAYRKKEPVLLDLKLVSTPGLHIYMGIPELAARKKMTSLILSTSKGILTSKEAMKIGVGGEVMAEIT